MTADTTPERENILDKLLEGSLLELDPTHQHAEAVPPRNLKFTVECEPDKIDIVIKFLEKLRDRLKADR